jgi:hypothetical protein
VARGPLPQIPGGLEQQAAPGSRPRVELPAVEQVGGRGGKARLRLRR